MRARLNGTIYTSLPETSAVVGRDGIEHSSLACGGMVIECREHLRMPVDLRVLFSTTDQTEIRQGTMFDISAAGCAVTSTVSMSPGTGVTLLIHATDLAAPITVQTATVRWVKHGEFGLEFIRLTHLDRSRLQRLLRLARPRSVPQD